LRPTCRQSLVTFAARPPPPRWSASCPADQLGPRFLNHDPELIRLCRTRVAPRSAKLQRPNPEAQLRVARLRSPLVVPLDL